MEGGESGGERVRGERERGRQKGRKSEHKMDIEKRIQSSKVFFPEERWNKLNAGQEKQFRNTLFQKLVLYYKRRK